MYFQVHIIKKAVETFCLYRFSIAKPDNNFDNKKLSKANRSLLFLTLD